MRIKIRRKDLRFVRSIIEQVIGVYSSSLHSNFLFKSLISTLDISVVYSDSRTGGLCLASTDGKNAIFLSVNPKDSEKFIAFIVAHELSH